MRNILGAGKWGIDMLHSGKVPAWKRAALGLLVSTAFATPSLAQDTAAPPADPATASAAAAAAPTDEEEIVVTATKRNENLQDVPIAITALSTKTLDDLNIDSTLR